MKKATTIIRMIDDLDKELYSRFTNKEIYDAVIKEEKKKPFWGGCTGLVSVISESTYNNVILDEKIEKNTLN